MNAAVKHTPGPWRVAGKGTIRTETGWIASMHWNNRDANAKLVAAAPDLLAELEIREGDLVMLLKAIEAGDPRAELAIRATDMLRETRAAIAKAEGRSP